MRILYLSHSMVRFKSPFPEELARRGHKVTLVAGRIKGVKILPKVKICRLPITSKEVTKEMVKALPEKKYDVIYAAGETTCKAGAKFKELLKIPLYLHAEWVPPFRVGLEDPRDWGYYDSSKIDIKGYKKYYQKIFQAWLQADRRSLAGRDMVAPLERFLGVKIECDFFYPFVETKITNNLFNKKIKEKYQIVTIARLVSWKRIHMTIEALSLLNDPPLLVIIGGGKEKRFLKRLAKKKRVRCKFLGEFSGTKKFRIIQESMFGVQIWSGIPPVEELLMGKPCITFDVPYMRELYGDALEYVPNNDVQALAKKIQFLINNRGVVKSKVESARQQILSHKLKIDTVANRALFLERKLAELVGSKRD